MTMQRVVPGLTPVKDQPTVNAAGERAAPRIGGVVVRLAVTQVDDRGELTEILNPAWGIDEAPMVYAYQSLIRPGMVKGWIVHRKQEDRLFVSMGFGRFVLYDARDDSPTCGLIEEAYLSERNRGLIRIPRGVFHAVENVGDNDLVFVNCPSRPYDHQDPDKYRLPLDTDQIPYRFDGRRRGW
jgi:dTDP-4-dehydrorhamnose 3,5-epimerase